MLMKEGEGSGAIWNFRNVYCEMFQRCRVENFKQCIQVDVFIVLDSQYTSVKLNARSKNKLYMLFVPCIVIRLCNVH